MVAVTRAWLGASRDRSGAATGDAATGPALTDEATDAILDLALRARRHLAGILSTSDIEDAPEFVARTQMAYAGHAHRGQCDVAASCDGAEPGSLASWS